MEKGIRWKRLGWLISGFFIVGLGTGLSSSVVACEKWVARIVAVQGDVEHRTATSDWEPLKVHQEVCAGDSVKVGDDSRAALYLSNNSFVRLDANSLLHFPEKTTETHFWVELNAGIAHFISRIIHRFQVSTPYVNAVVEGTEFIVSANNQRDAVSVVEGRVKTFNAKSSTMVTANQQVSAAGPDQPIERRTIPATGQVQWAVFYPPVLTLSQLRLANASDKQWLDTAIRQLLNNRPDLALQALNGAGASPVIQVARAALLLSVGRIDKFDSVVASILNTDQAASGYSLQALADAARDMPQPALAAANHAVKLAPDRASSYIALSYAQQAALELDAALSSALQATRVEPDNTLAWLRLSEMYLTQGDLGAAYHAVNSAGNDPLLAADIEGAKGFIQLFSLRLNSAEKDFRAALQLQSGNPRIHLGLGLTLIRKGDLAAGRRQLEYAVSLDPLRSILRSYLGRAYFAEKRNKEAIKQWRLAKQYDPNDPTPYFYSGIYKLFRNDPVGAIEQLEKSRNLNDSRAVYRSQALLQSDAASRSAALARAYNEVGYDQGVLLSGADALRRDTTNAEGHRLLADKYLDDPRYESARVSELLQSQLWQPINAYPLQPQLSETDLSVVAGSGPQRPGLNEYHTLFNRNGGYGLIDGYGAGDGTWGDDVVGSVLAGPVSLSVGQFHYETNGWKENANQQQDAYNGLFQAQILPGTKLQYEHRYLNTKAGDLSVSWPGKLTTYPVNNDKKMTDRVGLVHMFDADNAMVFSYIRQNRDFYQESNISDLILGALKTKSDPDSAELQVVHRYSKGQFIAGVGQVKDKPTDISNIEYQGYPYVDSTLYSNVKYSDAYVYWNGHLSSKVNLDLGAELNTYLQSYRAVDNLMLMDSLGKVNSRQWSPKFGLVWDVSNALTFRLAGFRNLARQYAADQTIAPTQVAGFNQLLRSDNARTDNQTKAVALDGKFNEYAFYGVSYINQYADFPYYSVETNDYVKGNSSEDEANAYIVVSPWSFLTLSVKYSYDMYQENQLDTPIDKVVKYRAQKVPLQLSWRIGMASSIRLSQTYYKQNYTVPVVDNMTNMASKVRVSDENWVSGLVYTYQDPGRRGKFSVGVSNLFDVNTEYVDVTRTTYSFYPARTYFVHFLFSI